MVSPLGILQILIVLSRLPDASVVVSPGMKAMPSTTDSCPRRVFLLLPVAVSQTITLESRPPDASVLPPKQSDDTGPSCPPLISMVGCASSLSVIRTARPIVMQQTYMSRLLS